MKKLACLLMVLFLAAPVAGAEVTFIDRTVTEETADAPSAQDGTQDDTMLVIGSAPAQSGSEDEGWPRTIVVTVGGDCTLGTTDSQRKSESGFDNVVKEKGYAWPFSELLEVFGQDDLTLVNFEGTLTESEKKTEGKLFNFKGPAEYAQMLVLGSVEAVNLANNHFIDYGDEGEADTMAALDAQGIAYCAPKKPTTVTVRGVKIGLIGNTFPYTEGKRDISKDVQALRDEGCQIVIASFHWGSEYKELNRDQVNIGRAAIKSGADVVVGHHPHIIQGIERYEDTYILYSLGNLVFGGNVDPDHRDTFIAQFTFTVHEDGRADGPELKIIPMRVTELKKGTDYRPVFAGDDYDRILKKILSLSRNMGDFVNPE